MDGKRINVVAYIPDCPTMKAARLRLMEVIRQGNIHALDGVVIEEKQESKC